MKKSIFKTFNPANNLPLNQEFYESDLADVGAAVEKAEEAFSSYGLLSQVHRSQFLLDVASQLDKNRAEIIKICHEETALPLPRLEGELSRTTGQIKMFADLLQEGSWVGAIIDTALPDRNPLPRADIRQMQIPLGPVAVFGASNFPLAFSVAGGDTISALAAGCPVVFKSHPEHPGTSKLVAQAINNAVEQNQLQPGVFQILYGESHSLGAQLVLHPKVKAVGFTGSFQGGKALFDLANQRAEPIPVFAEMGSVNPMVVFPQKLLENPIELAKGFVQSLTLGVGQFCTNPGLVFVSDTDGLEVFLDNLKKAVNDAFSGHMLSQPIAETYAQKTQKLEKHQKLKVLAQSSSNNLTNEGCPQIFITDFKDFVQNPEFKEEVFGPAAILVKVSPDELDALAEHIPGQLTATFHATPNDLKEHQELILKMGHKVGRLILNGFPTGVEVCHAMVHGGPFPASTQLQSTSVGSEAIKRYTRPLCFQNFSDEWLPAELKHQNPLNIMRKYNGILKR